jgi:threonine dehydrogenase-like Zn-dependent dehydrogenase
MRSRASVLTGRRTIEVQEFTVPDDIGEGALLRIEITGLYGSDWEQYKGAFEDTVGSYPVIPGHEPIGRIERIDDTTSERWGVEEGDRVAVEPIVSCGLCDRCTDGDYTLCPNRFHYGYTGTDHESGLWGGYAEWMVLRPNTRVHPLPPSTELPPELAVMFNPLGAGFEWVHKTAEAESGDTILVLGPGQRGLASTIAANELGASDVIVTGLEADERQLELAREFGATHTINIEAEHTVEKVMEITDGTGVDRVIDTTPNATQPILDAVEAVRSGGTITLAGLKDMAEVPGFVSDKLVWKGVTMRGVLAVRAWAYKQTIRVIAEGEYPLERMHDTSFGLADADKALELAGSLDGIHVTIDPGK